MINHLLVLISGSIYSLGMAPLNWWPLSCIAIAVLFVCLHQSARPMLTAWLFGVGKYGVGASWVYVSINEFGQAAPPLASALVFGFVLFVALYCLPIGWLFQRFRSTSAVIAGDTQYTLHNVWLFAAAWALMDWSLTWLLTGFPWLFPGFALTQTWAAGLMPIFGVLGGSFLVVLSIGCVARLVALRSLHWPTAAIVLVVWGVGGVLSGYEWTESYDRKEVALVQGNLDQKTKWLPERAIANVQRHLQLSEAHWQADLVIWPEAAVTMYAHQAQGVFEHITKLAEPNKTNVIVGVPAATENARGDYEFSNLALGLGAARGQFAKHHLVPFGDYVPLENQLRGIIEFFDLPMSNASPGGANQKNIQLSFAGAALAICYEVAYGESMRRQAIDAGVLVTITNDTWFGRSIGPHQHMQIASMRALENGRWLLRAANNGITAIVDAKGQEVARLPQFEADVLRGEFMLMQGRTPYSYLGNWPLLIFLLAFFVMCFVRQKRRENSAA